MLIEDRHAGPAETAAARIDVNDWFARLPAHDRKIAQTLALGEKEYLEAVHEEPEWFADDGSDDLDFWDGNPVAPLVDRGFSDLLGVLEEGQLDHFGEEDGQ